MTSPAQYAEAVAEYVLKHTTELISRGCAVMQIITVWLRRWQQSLVDVEIIVVPVNAKLS